MCMSYVLWPKWVHSQGIFICAGLAEEYRYPAPRVRKQHCNLGWAARNTLGKQSAVHSNLLLCPPGGACSWVGSGRWEYCRLQSLVTLTELEVRFPVCLHIVAHALQPAGEHSQE